MGQSRHNLGLYVLLNIFPLLAAYRRSIRKELLKVPWLDIRGNATILNSTIVRDDCFNFSNQTGQKSLTWSILTLISHRLRCLFDLYGIHDLYDKVVGEEAMARAV